MVTIELALIRFAVVAKRWEGHGGGMFPDLNAFLAGWCLRAVNAPRPVDVGRLRDSFWAGWREADESIAIAEREAAKDRL